MAETAVDIPIVREEPTGVEVVIDEKAAAAPVVQPTAVAEPVVAPVVAAAPVTRVVTADEGIDSLKEQAERARRESAERLAAADRKIAEAYKVAADAQRETATVKLDQVGLIIEGLTRDKESARRDYRTAMEAGDFDKAADAQDRIATAAARIVKAEEGKLALADDVKNPPTRHPVQTRQMSGLDPNDPVEIVAQQMGSPRSANWIRSHPEMVKNDGTVSPLAMAGHSMAMFNGHIPDSDGYFSFIEQFVRNGGKQDAPRQDRQEPVTPPPAPRQEGRNMNASTSAPVGRDTVQAPGAERPGVIRLEAHEVQTALDTFQPLYPKESRDQILKRYAMNKAQLMDEGKIGRRAS